MKCSCVLPLAVALLAAGCASRPLPKYEKPLALAPQQTVRTTAYTHTEADHTQYGARSASGGRLQSGTVNSAACDWSRWPLGTVFRIRETGERHIVDDYGWALAGTNTIDLYKTSRSAMNRWGVRRVNIDMESWGDVDRSLAILRPRSKHRHVRRMLDQIEDRYAVLSAPPPVAPVAAIAAVSTEEPVAPAELASTPVAPRAVAVSGRSRPLRASTPGSVQLTPFVASESR